MLCLSMTMQFFPTCAEVKFPTRHAGFPPPRGDLEEGGDVIGKGGGEHTAARRLHRGRTTVARDPLAGAVAEDGGP